MATLATCKCACLLVCIIFHMATCVGVKVIFAIFCQVPCDKAKTAPRWIRLTGAAGKWRLKRKNTVREK